MSLRVLTSVWESSKHSGGKLLLMLAIADNASDLGYAWPGENTLARKTRLSKRQVHRLIHELESDGDELVVIWGGTGAKSTNRYYVLVGKKPDEIKTIKHHVSEQNDKRQKEMLPMLAESRGDGDQAGKVAGVKMSPINKGDILDGRGTFETGKGDILDNKGDIAMSPEPINRINHQQQNHNITERVTVALYPSAQLNKRPVGDVDDFLSLILDDLDIRGKKRREIEHAKPNPDYVLAHALYAASRKKTAGWVIVETLAGAVPQSDFISFARLAPAEWLALWRGATRGEWDTCPPQLYQLRGAWLQAFDGVFEHEPFTEIAPVEVSRPEQDELPSQDALPVASEQTSAAEPTEHERLWSKALDYMGMRVTTATMNVWLSGSVVVNDQCNGKLVIKPGRTGEMINRLLPIIRESVERAAGHPVEVELV